MVIDRVFGVLTRIDPTKAEVTGQLVVDYNPGDVVFVDERFAWVTRRETDRMDSSIGGDLIEVDSDSMTTTGRRLDLADVREERTIEINGMSVSVTVEPKPLRAAVVGGLIIVGLDRLSSDDISLGLEGMIAIVDPSTQSLEPTFVSLPRLKNCGEVYKIPQIDEVLVVCNGFPYNDLTTSEWP